MQVSGVTISDDDHGFMRQALRLAEEAAAAGEVPVGSVMVHEGVVVGVGRNRREQDHDPLAHAEILAVATAATALSRWRLTGCTLYVTLEPCFMCAGALVNARVDRLVFGALDPKAGAVGSLADVCRDHRLNHRLHVDSGLLHAECAGVLQRFFAQRRGRKTTAGST